MDSYLLDLAAALWFGILTSISPCPLATNLAAISFIGRQVESRRMALLAGLLYTLGRTITYTVLGAALVTGAHAVPKVSMFLQTRMLLVLGPLLVVVGIVLLGVIPFSLGGGILSDKSQKLLARSGLWGAAVLGMVFALSFCPVSAGLFFGSTFSIAVRHDSRILMPALYGIGTAAPVVAFAFVLAFAAHAVGAAFDRVAAFEKWARRISAAAFIAAGLYLAARYNLRWF